MAKTDEVPGIPLERGDIGDPVRDLQHRLAGQGCPVPSNELGVYGQATEQAVRDFQAAHGLPGTGTCDLATWQIVVEASYQLGERLLYLKSPMVRGDDVAQLQRRLNSLGFDAGRVDGIFGPDTERALRDFQRNMAINLDGIFGPDTRLALARLGDRVEQPVPVAAVRERERLRTTPRKLHDRRIVVGDAGGLGALASALVRSLTEAGARVVLLQHPDLSIQAREANGFDAELFIGLELHPGEISTVSYYATTGWESIGGHHLADLVVEELRSGAQLTLESPQGMRVPILRETRMPAVLCALAPTTSVVAQTAELGSCLRRAIARWIVAPTS